MPTSSLYFYEGLSSNRCLVIHKCLSFKVKMFLPLALCNYRQLIKGLVRQRLHAWEGPWSVIVLSGIGSTALHRQASTECRKHCIPVRNEVGRKHFLCCNLDFSIRRTCSGNNFSCQSMDRASRSCWAVRKCRRMCFLFRVNYPSSLWHNST